MNGAIDPDIVFKVPPALVPKLRTHKIGDGMHGLRGGQVSSRRVGSAHLQADSLPVGIPMWPRGGCAVGD